MLSTWWACEIHSSQRSQFLLVVLEHSCLLFKNLECSCLSHTFLVKDLSMQRWMRSNQRISGVEACLAAGLSFEMGFLALLDQLRRRVYFRHCRSEFLSECCRITKFYCHVGCLHDGHLGILWTIVLLTRIEALLLHVLLDLLPSFLHGPGESLLKS